MTLRTMAAATLAAATLSGSSLVLAASDSDLQDEWRLRHREAVREIRDAVRDAMRDVRVEVGPVVRDVVRDVMREVQAATSWAWQGDDAWERAERRREQADRRREAAERRRERAEARRDEAARQRDERAFRTVSPTDDPCADRRGDRDRGHACEVRDTRLPAPIGPLTVDASPNGGIRVEAWDQADILVRAVVQAWGDDDAEARDQLGRVRVDAAGTRVTAEGPSRSEGRRRSGWSVSFRIWAPAPTALALTARNGGISLHGMRGESRFSTNNGGVVLEGMGGKVVGTTRNGGVNVRLDGTRWDGDGLDVETTNGGVSVAVPAGYSAELETGTVNGGFRTDLPLTVQGRLDRQVRATLGSGGPLLKVTTTNGGVRITQR
ncbi:MAG: DUF4097 domain-containing protein [Vicinamibacterales bacterium]